MNDNSDISSGNSTKIELFASQSGIHAITSPVRVKILTMLRSREMSFDEIVCLSGRAKSTVSVHLKDLVQDGIVDSRPDPEDARRKIFFISSHFLGEMSHEDRLKLDMSRYLQSYITGEEDPSRFFRLILRTIRLTFLGEGITIDPLLHLAGMHVGEAAYPTVAARDVAVLLRNLGVFWERNRLGRIEVEGFDPLAIKIYDCFECSDLPNLGRPACAFDAGVLTAVFSAHYRKEQVVTETNCYAMEDDCCRFVVERKRQES
jgi:uncharacterized protein